jgi:tetratricopeptide (TPR) repeat protein
VLALRTVVVGRITPEVGRLDNVIAGAPAVPRLLTAVAVVARYAATLVWPFRLSADYSYPQIPLVESPGHPLFLAGLAILAGMAALAVWGWRRNAHVAFAIAFMAATFAVVSNLLAPIGTIMAERLLYVPSIGFCLLLAIGIDRAGRSVAAAPRPSIVLAIGVASVWAIATVDRNRVWSDRVRFFETMVRDAPDSARSHRELAVVLSELGQHDRAREEVQLALRLDPGNAVTLYNLGNVELRAGRLNDAMAAYQAALKEDPAQVDAMTNLGNAYSAGGDERSAEQWFRRGLEHHPDSATLRLNLANALLRQGRPAEAEEHYRAAVERLPDDPLLRFNYGVCLESVGRFDAAVEQYRAALAGMPDGVVVMVRMVAALAAAGRLTEALAQQATAEARFPADPRVRQTRQLLTQAQGAAGPR